MSGVELTPEDAAQRVLGLLESGNGEDALALALALAEQCPDNMSVLYVAGQACWQAGRRADAVEFQKRLIGCDPSNGQLHRNLVELLMRMDDQPGIAAAADAAETAGIADSGLINTGGLAHYKLGDKARALALFRRAADIDPGNAKALQNISVVLMDQGDGEAAVEAYGRSLKAWSQDDGALPPDELASRYDARAGTYDETELHQYFSQTMAAFINDVAALGAGERVLDVACGTGGVGRNLKATGAEFWGLDLSAEMLAVARAGGDYATLVEGDMIAAMSDLAGPFDAVVCCCSLYHLNHLDGFFAEAARLLSPGGRVFISVDPAPDNFEIAVTGAGEFAHSRAYLRRLATEAGLAELDIRIMNHRMMPGFWCAFQR